MSTRNSRERRRANLGDIVTELAAVLAALCVLWPGLAYEGMAQNPLQRDPLLDKSPPSTVPEYPPAPISPARPPLEARPPQPPLPAMPPVPPEPVPPPQDPAPEDLPPFR